MQAWINAEPQLAWGLGAIVLFLLIGWPLDVVFKRALDRKGGGVRHGIYFFGYTSLWILAGVVVWAWAGSGRSLDALGLAPSTGPFWTGAWVITGLGTLWLGFAALQSVFSLKARADNAAALEKGGDLSMVSPETPWQRRHFYLLALAAGVCEEIIFRGFLIGVLALVMPLWAAAGAALAVFIAAHAYQGMAGMVRILPISIVLTLMFILSGSLFPGMVLHTVVDVAGGVIIYFARKAAPSG